MLKAILRGAKQLETEKVTEKGEFYPVKAVLHFDLDLGEIAPYNNKSVNILTDDELSGRDLKMSDIFDRLDAIGSSILKIAQIVKEIDEAKPNVGLSSSESV